MGMFGAKVSGSAELKRDLDWLRATFPEWLASGNLLTANAIRDRAHQNILDIDAYDTTALYYSLRIKTARRGLTVLVGSISKYAPYIEFGTRPHWPPISKIRAWCIRKGLGAGAAFVVARKIAERGTPPRPWLNPAFLAERRFHLERMRTVVNNGLKTHLKASLGRK